MITVAIFTDNDFTKVNGVTTTLRAVLDHAPDDVRPRVYTCEARPVDTDRYVALSGPGVGIPFYNEMKMYLPPFRRFLRRAAADRVDVVHFTTPGPVGLAALFVAARLKLPMVGSFHTDLPQGGTRAYYRGNARLVAYHRRYFALYDHLHLQSAPIRHIRRKQVASSLTSSRIDSIHR